MEAGKETFSDTELISSLMNDKSTEACIKFIYRQHFDLLSRYVLNNSGNEQDAEDIFQEVVVAFINLVKAGKFRGESSIKTFLFSLNKNIWLNELKRKGRASVREEKYNRQNDQNEPTVDIAMELRHTRKELMQTLERLGENCKTILLLYYFENKSMKEILESLPYENEQVVRNKKSKCLKKLEAIITENKALYQQLKNYLHG
ncbi:MAG: sigma-70 family RNA polymerase sigma factor [Bacteroidota bacterium]|nr:sigma-70 family RNA polymerase sigma factor [Bacteroidota bacterium]